MGQSFPLRRRSPLSLQQNHREVFLVQNDWPHLFIRALSLSILHYTSSRNYVLLTRGGILLCRGGIENELSTLGLSLPLSIYFFSSGPSILEYTVWLDCPT